jgi:hypothetical protein
MDKRLLFPAVAITAWAQTAPVPHLQGEEAVRARAEQFFQLEVDKSFRKAEGLVATESKDYYYNQDKPDIKSFRIEKVELSADGKSAKVTAILNKILRAPQLGAQEFPMPYTSDWKLEDGEWMWYFIPTDYIDTPFGKWGVNRTDGGAISLPPGMPARAESLNALVSVDRTSVELTAGSTRAETVTISNKLPGTVSIEIGKERPHGLKVTVDKKQLGRGEKAIVSFSISGDEKPNGTVEIKAAPLQSFLIHVTTK